MSDQAKKFDDATTDERNSYGSRSADSTFKSKAIQSQAVVVDEDISRAKDKNAKEVQAELDKKVCNYETQNTKATKPI